ncbi:MAG: hypothetical protein ACR2NU_09605, partial [Aeoliella sp.]
VILAAATGGYSLPAARELACGSTTRGDFFMQNDEWHFVHRAEDDAANELYVKPDDLWETNDVASRCPDVVEDWLDRAHALQILC